MSIHYLKDPNEIKIGSPSDAAGSNTLFGQIASSNNTINTVNTNISNVNTSLNSVSTNINTVNTNVNTVLNSAGLSSDSANSNGSIHAKILDMKNSLGNIADTANAAGSLHAKIVDLKNTVNAKAAGTDFSSKTPKIAASVNFNGTIYKSVINITGSGYLTGLYQIPYTPNYGLTYNGYFRVIIDGTTLITDMMGMQVLANNGSANTFCFASIPMFLRFKTSLQVDHKISSSGSSSISSYVMYLLD